MPLRNWFKSKAQLEKEKQNRFEKDMANQGKKPHHIQSNYRYDPGHTEWYTNDEWAKYQAEEFKMLANARNAQAAREALEKRRRENREAREAEIRKLEKAEELQRCRTIVAEANSQRGGRKTRRNRKTKRNTRKRT